jgi:cytochrome c biogenesis protein CcdA
MRIAGLVSLAFVDSINPSAIVVTLYLLARSRAAVQVAVYVAAIFVTYFALGTTMMLGVDRLAPSLDTVLDSRPGLIAQSLVGLTIVVYCVAASTARSESDVVAPPSASTYAALAALGVTVTAMELPTALPYFAAIALLASAGLPSHEWVPLLLLYNAIFVLPPIALLVGHLVLGQRVGERYEALGQRLQRAGRETALWIGGLVGGAVFVTSAIELVARWH